MLEKRSFSSSSSYLSNITFFQFIHFLVATHGLPFSSCISYSRSPILEAQRGALQKQPSPQSYTSDSLEICSICSSKQWEHVFSDDEEKPEGAADDDEDERRRKRKEVNNKTTPPPLCRRRPPQPPPPPLVAVCLGGAAAETAGAAVVDDDDKTEHHHHAPTKENKKRPHHNDYQTAGGRRTTTTICSCRRPPPPPITITPTPVSYSRQQQQQTAKKKKKRRKEEEEEYYHQEAVAKAGIPSSDSIVMKVDMEAGNSRLMSGMESIFVQFATLRAFPKVHRVLSSYHAGEGATAFGPCRKMLVDLTLVEKAWGNDVPAKINFINMHGMHYHRRDVHLRTCPKANPSTDELVEPEPWDVWKGKLAETLSKVDPLKNIFEYRVIHECDLFHKPACPDPSEVINPRYYEQGGEVMNFGQYRSLEHFLGLVHPIDSVLGIHKETWTQTELVNHILAQKPDSSFSGFVYIRKGQESKEDLNSGGLPSTAWSCCHQRTTVKASELGPFTHYQSSQYKKAKGLDIENYANKEQTVLKSGFSDEGETISTDYLAWLIRNRKFTGFIIEHFLFYRKKHFLSPALRHLLQARHTLKLNPYHDKLLSACYKLCGNGFFGFQALEITRFTNTTFCMETNLVKYETAAGKRKGSKVVEDPNLFSIEMVGIKERKKGGPMPILALSRHRPNARIFNASQVAVQILSESRVMFMDKAMCMFKNLDGRKAQLAYYDTDSLVWCHSRKEFGDILLEESKPREAELRAFLFEDTTSPHSQAGKLKIEGQYTSGYFRSGKCYHLSNNDEADDEKMIRMKGLQKKNHKYLKVEHFGTDPWKNTPSCRTFNMKPTLGHEIHMVEESKSLGHSMNLKKYCVVSRRWLKEKKE